MTTSVTNENDQATTQLHPLLTVHEVATMLRVDNTTVRRWVKVGMLEAVSLPHKNIRTPYRIKRETVEKLLSQVNTPSQEPDYDTTEA
jgi:excisionase family DNA binding protein